MQARFLLHKKCKRAWKIFSGGLENEKESKEEKVIGRENFFPLFFHFFAIFKAHLLSLYTLSPSLFYGKKGAILYRIPCHIRLGASSHIFGYRIFGRLGSVQPFPFCKRGVHFSAKPSLHPVLCAGNRGASAGKSLI